MKTDNGFRYCSAKKLRGFTLIELLVVIAIIGLLSSVVLASLNSARAKSRDARRLSDKNQIKIALEMAYDKLNDYPVSSGWKCLAPSSETCWRGAYTGSDSVLSALASYLPVLPRPNASGSGNYATNAYLYISDYSGGSVGPSGAYLVWYQEAQIGTDKCAVAATFHYDAYWYCYEWLGSS